MPYTVVPSPAELGLPDKFGEFRPQQPPAILHLANNEKRFGILSAPTATGKSLIYMSLPRLMKKRALVLVGTKGLMDQLMRDFGGVDRHGRVTADVRGQSNYRCIALDKGGQLQGYGLPGSSCEIGPCHAKVACSHLRDRSCHHYAAIDAAARAHIVVSNYAFWLALSRNQDPNLIGKFDLLVLDEAHTARDWLAGFCEVEIDYAIAAKYTPLRIPEITDGIAAWAGWADASSVYVKAAISEVEAEVSSRDKEVRHLNELTRLLQALTSIADAGKWLSSTQSEKNVRVPGRSIDWVAERTKYGAKWSPLWGYPYAERYLYRGIPKIVLSSATITPSARKYLAISKEESDFYEVPATISPLRRPLIYIPTVRLSAKTTTAEDLRRWVARIDEIIEGRLDRKGIIHARSYDRARYILDNSRHAKILLTHKDSRDLQRVVDYYKSAKAPVVLVSPSLEEGFDFPGDDCRYQIIVKVPFIDTRSPLAKGRDQSDKSYGLDVTATAIMQMVGRAVRSEDDRAETFLIDDQWNWFRYREAERFPESFRAAFKQVDRVPKAMSLTGSLSPFAR